MSFQTPLTVSQAIENIERDRYLLPGIQREFVWKPEQIERLFDSLLCGYPISSFLFWRVEGETKGQHDFYRFLRNYRQKYKTHNEEIDARHINDFQAVLDGQQRLTALYIGLRGSYAYKRPRVRDLDNEYAYPTRRLYLDLQEATESEEEDGLRYNFVFLLPAEAQQHPQRWFEVPQIMSLADDFEFEQYLEQNEIKKNRFGWQALSKLKRAVHSTPTINYYLESEPSLDKALNIFIRINSSGEPLSHSDLVMSVAVSAWKKRKAREEIHRLVDEILNLGFQVKKDIVLRLFLLLHSEDIRFNPKNFTKDIAAQVEDAWEDIAKAFFEVFRLLKFLGFSNSALTSNNAVLPIVYYVMRKGNAEQIVEAKAEEKNRQIIARWLHVMLLNQSMANQSDRVLRAMRDAMREHCEGDFPAVQLFGALEKIDRKPRSDDEFLEHLLSTRKDDWMAFSLLSLLSPSLGNEEWRFEKDHLHPRAGFKEDTLRGVGVSEEELAFCLDEAVFDSLPNLHLLAERENRSKQDQPLEEWIKQRAGDLGISEADLRSRSLIPAHVSLDLKDFKMFFLERKEELKGRLRKYLEPLSN